ncbi:MAG: O-antigen ligase family protein [Rhodoferax sp.]|uniref:O-antigen ligase family protein n=1 Tax=Rhodoferax sp. TaxID=50421 RepID=UPI003015F389
MNSIKGAVFSNFVEYICQRRFLHIFSGSIAVAVLVLFISVTFSEVAALLTLAILLFMAVPKKIFQHTIFIPIILLPLGSTTLIPHEMLGLTGLNPLNASLFLTIGTLMLIWMVQPWKVSYPRWPGYFWAYVFMMTLGALHGAMHVDEIPEYFRALKVINFNTVGGYLQDTFFKQMLILVTAYIFSFVVRNALNPTYCLVPLFASTLVLPITVIAIVSLSGESLSYLASSDSRGFLSVIGMHANELGLMFNMMFALSIFCFFNVPGASKKFNLGLISLTLMVAIALTFSRGAYLGFIAVVMYLLISKGQFRITLLAIIICIGAVILVPDAVIERASSGIAHGSADDISAGRVSGIWIPLVEDILSSPLIGHGRSSILWTDAAKSQSILPVGHPHSAYLATVLDYGLLGVIIFILFYIHMWRVFKTMADISIEPVWRGFFRGSMACILLLLVQGLTDDSFTPSSTQPYLWLAYGAAVGLISRINSQTRGDSSEEKE